jgi:hypothetical protein
MEWADIWKIVVTAVMSMGGVGVIIYGIINFSANKIAERLAKKYEFILDKKLEAYKSDLDKKNYISKARFDMEFSIYGEISAALLIAVESCFWLFPTCLDSSPQDQCKAEEFFTKRYTTAIDTVINLQRILGSKSPFISEELYNDFMKIKELLNIQVNMYSFCGPLQKMKGTLDKVAYNGEMEAFSRTDEITNKHKDIVIKMRKYFDTLEIREE